MSPYPVCTPHLNTYELQICDTGFSGRSIFASRAIPSNTVIEISPVLLFSAREYDEHGKHTILDSYTFVWERSLGGNTMALALGLGSLFNHHPTSANVSYELCKNSKSIKYRTVKHVAAGEELLICYGAGRMWWEPEVEETATAPPSEADELALLSQLSLERGPQQAQRAPIDPAYSGLLWRVTSSPDPKSMPLDTAMAWAMDVPPKACSTVVRILQSIVKENGINVGQLNGSDSIRHLRGFRQSCDVRKYDEDEQEYDVPSSDALSMLLSMKRAHSKNELESILTLALHDLNIPVELYLVRVPTTPAPMRERLSEWAAVWPCVFLPPGAGIAPKHVIPGSDFARAAVPVDRDRDQKLWNQQDISVIQAAFSRCVQAAKKAKATGDVEVGAYVTSLDATITAVDVAAFDTRFSDQHPLHHAVPNVIRKVAALRSTQRNSEDAAKNSENGQDYLLSGLSLFVTHEPCVYCAMALVHSRVKSVFFLYPSPGTGGFCGAEEDGYASCTGMEDGGPFAVQEQSGLNHRYDVWRWVDPSDWADAELPQRLPYDL